jgi:peptidoglycan/xylan/chitin deacetylase (PgdA/CDA1 family)
MTIKGKFQVINKAKICIFLSYLFFMLNVSTNAIAAEIFQWPNQAKAAVSLAYDDALNSQLDTAVPALSKYQLKASFYLTLSASTVQTRLTEWQALAEQGHELGNHTINHACKSTLPGREWVRPENDLDKKTVAQIIAEVTEANRRLHAIDGKKTRTFTVPCTDTNIGGVNYVEQVSSLFVGIKYSVGDVAKSMSEFDVLKTPVWSPENVSGDELIAYVEQAKKYGTLASITFHGVGGDYLGVSAQAHEQLLNYLDKNRHIYWVDTFKRISLHIKDQKFK